mgnify:CR=1 FL=1
MDNSSSFNLTIISTIIAMISTILGALCIFFVKNNLNKKYYKMFLGFISGMMISSSIWSLLIPATKILENKFNNLVYISAGFLIGALSFKFIDKFILSIVMKNNFNVSSSLIRKSLIILSSSLRNLIEGISIGIAFSLSNGSLAGALTLSSAMVLQNFPEGFSLSIPLKNAGLSKFKSFAIASIPGIVEPIGGVLGIILSNKIALLMPIILSFTAGSIITVVVDEIIPDYNNKRNSTHGTLGFTFGFILLLMLDILIK